MEKNSEKKDYLSFFQKYCPNWMNLVYTIDPSSVKKNAFDYLMILIYVISPFSFIKVSPNLLNDLRIYNRSRLS